MLMHCIFASSLDRSNISGINVLYYIGKLHQSDTGILFRRVCVNSRKKHVFLVSSVKRACILALKKD